MSEDKNPDIDPYDPTVDYTDAPAIKEIAKNYIGFSDIPEWKPLNMSRRRFIQGVVCSGIAVSNTAIPFCWEFYTGSCRCACS